MREIKFRAWDKRCNVMTPLRSWDFAHGTCEVKHMYDGDDCPDEIDLDIMQFTGLHDQNGKEIYEGDIVRFSDGYPHDEIKVVEFKDGKFTNIHPYDTGGATIMEPYVIGNIHENPDLLNETH